MKNYAVKFGETTSFYDSIEIIISAETIYSLIVKAGEMCNFLNKMHDDIRYEICEIILMLED